jgi:hypothetical protein
MDVLNYLPVLRMFIIMGSLTGILKSMGESEAPVGELPLLKAEMRSFLSRQ